jgi:Tfp pilus assembly protein PilX
MILHRSPGRKPGSAKPQAKRRGLVLSSELLLILPVLTLLAVALIEFVYLISAEAKIAEASREAARAAARGGAEADIQAAVKNVLGATLIDHACIMLIYPNCPAGDQPVVFIQTDGDGCCLPPDINGTVTTGCKTTGQPVSAKVSVPAKYMVPSILLRAVTQFDSLCLSRQSTMILE